MNSLVPPRRLERSSTDRVLVGVCGGLAQYLNLDPTLVRILTVVLTVVTGGTPVLLYVVAALLMPERATGAPPYGPSPTGYPTQPPPPAPGPWPYPPTSPDPVWGREGAPWEQPPERPDGPPASAGPRG